MSRINRISVWKYTVCMYLAVLTFAQDNWKTENHLSENVWQTSGAINYFTENTRNENWGPTYNLMYCQARRDPYNFTLSIYNATFGDPPHLQLVYGTNNVSTDAPPNYCNVLRLNWTEEFHILEDGRFLLPAYHFSGHVCTDPRYLSSGLLCIAVRFELTTGLWINRIGFMISIPFLLLTFLIYAVLPNPNLHRKALMSYVFSYMLSCALIIARQTALHMPPELCQFVAYTSYISLIASFIWMNVMCIEMWITFSGTRGYGKDAKDEQTRFIYYSLYAWGVPILGAIILAVIDQLTDKDAIYNPNFGLECFLEDGFPRLFYFYLPMAIFIGTNVTLFISTTMNILKIKKETKMLKHSDSKRHGDNEDEEQKFILYLKLFLAMGVNWVIEVISWLLEWLLDDAIPDPLFYLTSFTNCGYGLVIFFLFVFKKNIWIDLQKRFGWISRIASSSFIKDINAQLTVAKRTLRKWCSCKTSSSQMNNGATRSHSGTSETITSNVSGTSRSSSITEISIPLSTNTSEPKPK